MLRPQYIMFLTLVLLGGNLMCMFMEGSYLRADDVSVMNYLTGYSAMEVQGLIGVARVIIGFFSHGFARLIMWDYGFLSGGWELLKWVLMIFTVGAIYGFAMTFTPLGTGLISRR